MSAKCLYCLQIFCALVVSGKTTFEIRCINYRVLFKYCNESRWFSLLAEAEITRADRSLSGYEWLHFKNNWCELTKKKMEWKYINEIENNNWKWTHGWNCLATEHWALWLWLWLLIVTVHSASTSVRTYAMLITLVNTLCLYD